MDEKPLILIVEDDRDLAEMLEVFFRLRDYSVGHVEEGEKALERCQRQKPDVILLDIRLPDIDGFEVARRLRKQPRTATIPIIYLTERQAREDRLQGLSIGGDDYLTKPFDIQELRLRVQNAVYRSKFKSLTHPVTGLPEGRLVDEQLAKIVHAGDLLGALIMTLHGMEEFRDRYGFAAADDALRAVTLMPTRIEYPLSYYGHLDTCSLIIFADMEDIPYIRDGIEALFAQTLAILYPLEDLGDGELPGLKITFQQLSQLELQGHEEGELRGQLLAFFSDRKG